MAARRDEGAPSHFRAALILGALVIAGRVGLQMVFGNGGAGATVLYTMPQVPVVQLGGPVTLEGLVSTAYQGARLAAIIAALGAANALASPARLLRHVPATLYEVGTALVVALTFVPQLVDDAREVRAGRRLRGHSGKGPRELARLAVPVLSGALERSLRLAASMESRGYGRAVQRTRRAHKVAAATTLAGLLGVVIGLFGLLDVGSPIWLGLPLLAVGVVLTASTLVVGARRDARSAYRRDAWRLPEWLVLASAVAAAGCAVVGAKTDPLAMNPSTNPLTVPAVPLLALAGALVAVTAAFAAPPPPERVNSPSSPDLARHEDVPA